MGPINKKNYRLKKSFISFLLLTGTSIISYPATIKAVTILDRHRNHFVNSGYIKQVVGFDSLGKSDPVSYILGFTEQLGLTREQITKIKAAHIGYKKRNIRLTADIKITHLVMRNLLQSGQFDEKKILAKSNELEKLTSEKIRLSTETMVKVFKTLTSEQIKKIKELRLLSKARGTGPLEGS